MTTKKPPLKRLTLPITEANRALVRAEVKRSRDGVSAVVRSALTRSFKTFEPRPTFGLIVLDHVLTLQSSFNLPPTLIKRLEESAQGWRYSKAALFNALLRHAFNETEARADDTTIAV